MAALFVCNVLLLVFAFQLLAFLPQFIISEGTVVVI